MRVIPLFRKGLIALKFVTRLMASRLASTYPALQAGLHVVRKKGIISAIVFEGPTSLAESVGELDDGNQEESRANHRSDLCVA
jgi:hypothetical protein